MIELITQSFFTELEKLGRRVRIRGLGKKKVMWSNSGEIGNALLYGRKENRSIVKNLYKDNKGSAAKKQIKSMGTNIGPNIEGASVVNSQLAGGKGKGRTSLINRDRFGKVKAPSAEGRKGREDADKINKERRVKRRRTIAHESFHSNGPKLIRDNEHAAHVYGGFKGTKGSLKDKTKAAAKDLGQLYEGNPGKAQQELRNGALVVGGGALAASHIYNKRSKKQTPKK
jgi:hypothetical protein